MTYRGSSLIWNHIGVQRISATTLSVEMSYLYKAYLRLDLCRREIHQIVGLVFFLLIRKMKCVSLLFLNICILYTSFVECIKHLFVDYGSYFLSLSFYLFISCYLNFSLFLHLLCIFSFFIFFPSSVSIYY